MSSVPISEIVLSTLKYEANNFISAEKALIVGGDLPWSSKYMVHKSMAS
jgi:hypothetical protein